MGVSPKFWDQLNSGWPEEMDIPTDKEAASGVKKMWKHIYNTSYRGHVFVVRHRGRRTWSGRNPNRKARERKWGLVVSPLYEFPRQGWPAIVHDLSHYFHRRLHPHAKPHDSRQARIERDLQQFVITKLIKEKQ